MYYEFFLNLYKNDKMKKWKNDKMIKWKNDKNNKNIKKCKFIKKYKHKEIIYFII